MSCIGLVQIHSSDIRNDLLHLNLLFSFFSLTTHRSRPIDRRSNEVKFCTFLTIKVLAILVVDLMSI